MTDCAFSGKAAFVTGAASGIGRAIAEEFGRRGLQVIVADIDQSGAERVAAGIEGASAVKLDVGDEENWVRALDLAEDRHGPLCVLASNAGVAGVALPLAQTSFDAWEWSRRINLDGAFIGLSHGARRIIASGAPGHIVATSSMSIFQSQRHMGTYVAFKAAVLALCEALHHELADHHIGVSVLLPGPVRTNLAEANLGRAPAGANVGVRQDAVIEHIKQGRDPGDVARMAAGSLGTGRFWLFTHPELEHRIDTRNAAMKAALNGA